MQKITEAQVVGPLVSLLDLTALEDAAADMLINADAVVDTLRPEAIAAIASRGYTRQDIIGWAVQEAGLRAVEKMEATA